MRANIAIYSNSELRYRSESSSAAAMTVLDRLVVELRLELLVVGDLAHGLEEVLLDDIVSLGTDSKHT